MAYKTIVNPIGKPLDFVNVIAAETDPVFSAWLSATPPLYNLNGALLATGATTGATSQSQVFTNGITLNATTIVTDTTTGLKIGGAANQKWATHGATPVVQQLATTDLGVVLSNKGIRAAGTAYPITTSGTVTLSGTFKHSGSTASFFNATGVSQQTATTDLGTALSNLGLRAAGTAYPITTSGAVTLTGATTVTLNSATAFKVSSTTADILTVDTTNNKVIIGGATHEIGFTGDESMIVLTTDLVTINDTVKIDTLTASKVVFTDASKQLTSTGIGTSAQFIKGDGSLDSGVYALANNVLALDNTTAFTPDADYEPATKKYVDDNAGGVSAHSDLTGLDYASAGHTGFEPTITAGTSAQFLKGDKSLGTTPMDLIETATPSGASSITFSGLTTGVIYKLFLNLTQNTNNGVLEFLINADTSNVYTNTIINYDTSGLVGANYTPRTYGAICGITTVAGGRNVVELTFQSAESNYVRVFGISHNTSTASNEISINSNVWAGGANLSSIRILTTAGTLTGTAKLYRLN